MSKPNTFFTRRELLTMIGKAAGGAAMYQAMSTLGFARESAYTGRPKLEGAKKGASVVILGAGLAGMVAALELQAAGYKVQILEYSQRAGGRCLTVRGGDTIREIDGTEQHCSFTQGEYLNPGPWRIPYHHLGVLDYCKRLGVALQPFVQVNHNAYLHSTRSFNGKPVRYRHLQSDFQGHVAELLSKAVLQGNLDSAVTHEDKEKLLEGLRTWGALDSQYAYRMSFATSERRGYEIAPGGGLMPTPRASELLDPGQVIRSELWSFLGQDQEFDFQTTLFQPVGGMDMIANAFERQLGDAIRYSAKVTRIEQNEREVTITVNDMARGGAVEKLKADWCVCTIPLSILSQIPVQASAEMLAAIGSVPYGSSVKIGLQFNRRFWEQDEHIYGGITNTNLPVSQIAYPAHSFGAQGKSVLLGAYIWEGANSFEFAAMQPDQRIRHALEQGSKIHPQYHKEFDSGISVAWYRRPEQLGCYGLWTDANREKHYKSLCQIDNRLVLAGEHASYIPAWQEGAILSSLDAITRLHARAQA